MPRANTRGVEAQPAYEWLLVAPYESSLKVRARRRGSLMMVPPGPILSPHGLPTSTVSRRTPVTERGIWTLTA